MRGQGMHIVQFGHFGLTYIWGGEHNCVSGLAQGLVEETWRHHYMPPSNDAEKARAP
jgi:hypothetical protein